MQLVLVAGTLSTTTYNLCRKTVEDIVEYRERSIVIANLVTFIVIIVTTPMYLWDRHPLSLPFLVNDFTVFFPAPSYP